MEVPEQRRSNPVPPDPDQARDLALRLLARRSLTRHELENALRRRKVAAGLARRLTAECVKAGYLDEKAIAEDHIRRGREYRLVGRFLLKYELTRRGLPETLVETVLNRLYPESAESEVARTFAERKLRSLKELPHDRAAARLGGALDRRGFGSAIISGIIHELVGGLTDEF